MKGMFYLLVLTALLALTFGAQGVIPARAAMTITVNSIADNTTNDGLCTLREAILAANVNAPFNGADDCDHDGSPGTDLIAFDPSLSGATIILGSSLPNIISEISMDGSALASQLTISGNSAVRVLYVAGPPAALTLQNLTIANGNASGGGVYNLGTLIVNNSTFAFNTGTSNAGGIFNFGVLQVNDSTFSNNSTSVGGGGAIANASGATASVTNSTFTSNSSSQSGGAISNISGTLNVVNSTFAYNTAATVGGGVHNNGGVLVVNSSTFSDNSANTGAGLMLSTGTNSLINTIIANSIWDNDCYINGAFDTLEYNLIEEEGGGSCNLTNGIGNISGVDPNLGTLADNGGPTQTFALLPGSPAIDAGYNDKCDIAPVNDLDQRGYSRNSDGDKNGVATCDIGSFEVPVLTVKSTGAQDGWVLESGENTNLGGTMESAATTLRLGDDAARKQYRSLLSFATGAALPDNAVITKVSLKVKRQGVAGGGDPVTIFQGFLLDIRKGTFGTAPLQVTDLQVLAQKTIGPSKPALVGGWYTFNLTGVSAYINKLATLSGVTQIRLSFKLDDNNNTLANYLSLYSGNAPLASRPTLIIEYYVP